MKKERKKTEQIEKAPPKATPSRVVPFSVFVYDKNTLNERKPNKRMRHPDYKRMAYGNDTGLVVVDIVQKVSLLVMCMSDLGSSAEAHQRALRSPKRQDDATARTRDADDKARSPSIDQVKCLSFVTSVSISFSLSDCLSISLLFSLSISVYLSSLETLTCTHVYIYTDWRISATL